jgi:hypothetical protein
MTQKFTTGKAFSTGEQVTAQDLEDIVEQSTPLTALTDDQTLTVNNGQVIVKDGDSVNGVPLAKMKHIAARSVICNTGSSTAAPTTLAIADNQVLKCVALGLEVGTIDNDNLTNNGISIDADSGTTHEIDLGETLTVAGGEGMDTTIANNTLTVAGEDASSSNKGIAKFNTDNFSVSSGDVTIKNGGVNNDELANSSLTVTSGTGLTGGGSISLGGSRTLNVSGLTNSELSGSAGITNANLANSSVTVTAGTGLSGGGSVALGASTTLNLDGTLPNDTTTNTQSTSDDSTKVATTAFVKNQLNVGGLGYATLTRSSQAFSASGGTVDHTLSGFTISNNGITVSEGGGGAISVPSGIYIIIYNVKDVTYSNPGGASAIRGRMKIVRNATVEVTNEFDGSEGSTFLASSLSGLYSGGTSFTFEFGRRRTSNTGLTQTVTPNGIEISVIRIA